jgi:hypothetical protein
MKHIKPVLPLIITSCISILIIGLLGYLAYRYHQQAKVGETNNKTLTSKNKELTNTLLKTSKMLTTLQNEDQVKKNLDLQKEIKNIEDTYTQSVQVYEELVKLQEETDKTDDLEKLFAENLVFLSKRNFASSEATLKTLSLEIQKKKTEIASTFSIPKSVAINNTAPGGGYQRQQVQTDVGNFMVDIIAADLNSTRVIVDTASEGDCGNDCPVDALGNFAARSGAYAGINGPYFCPASYPSCAGKTNSFDTLLMNKNKHYFNSDNNVYSTVPAVIFSGNSARFVGRSLEWGRDTGVDSVIAAQPMLVSNGEVVFGGDDEAKRGGQGTRAFIGASDSTAYIGVVYNANVAQVARVLKTMGIKNALNLDSGGSIALWSNGRYLAGPGRATPFGILFVRK